MSELEKAYKVMQADFGVGKGDTLRVLRSSKGNEMGWRSGWNSYMTKMVGKEFVADHVSEVGGIKLNGWFFPFFCLELIEKAKPELPAGVTFTADGLKVGEVYLSKDTIKRNLGL